MGAKTLIAAPYQWSLKEALLAFGRAFLCDWGGEAILRAWLKSQDITQEIINTSNAQTTYLTAGNRDTPPLLLIHGTPGSALSWWPYLKTPAGFRIIAVDRPGFSPVNREIPDPARDYDILAEILKSVSQTQPATIMGHSMGGGLAAKLAIDFPQHVKRLVLIGASLDPELEEIKPIQQAARTAPLKFLLNRSARNSNEELIKYPDFLKGVAADLNKIKCRVLIVHAKDDGLVPFENVAFMKKALNASPNIKTLIYDHGRHSVHTGKYKEILKEIEKTL